MNRQIAINIILKSIPSRDLAIALRNKDLMEVDNQSGTYSWRKDVIDNIAYQELLLIITTIKEDINISQLIREMAQITKTN